MVTIRSGQKQFTEDEVSRLTGICLDHLRSWAQSRQVGSLIRAAEAASAGAEKWLKLNADYARVWPNITIKRDPPSDSKEWEGKPDKLQYFSPKPGNGD